MSALSPKADIATVGMSALCQKRTYAVQQKSCLFDHLVGSGDQAGRDSKAECPRGLKIDSHGITRRSLDGELCRLFTFKNAIDIGRSASKLLDEVDTVRN